MRENGGEVRGALSRGAGLAWKATRRAGGARSPTAFRRNETNFPRRLKGEGTNSPRIPPCAYSC